MDFLTGMPLPFALLALALVDGLSVGTFLIPLFLLLAPGRVRVRRITLYLATISAFYLAVGMLLMLGIVNVIGTASAFIVSTPGRVLLLLGGVALLVGGVWAGVREDRLRKRARARGEDTARAKGRVLRWRDRALDDEGPTWAIVGVALAAGVVEVAGMLPYLIGMGLIANEQIGLAARYGMLVAYCLVMIAPALVAMLVRAAAGGSAERALQRVAGWMQRAGGANTAWLLAVVGALVARGAAGGLGILPMA
ncbi:GAP family protein [Microbacterium sp.]|uniref:GAP family protein n=1 Tax=Microbacterium sp. TaxID=51671 RepID=UPI0039E4F7DD